MSIIGGQHDQPMAGLSITGFNVPCGIQLTCRQTTTLELHLGCVDISYLALFLISVILNIDEI